MTDLEPWILAFAVGVAFFAGLIDAIAGGGGLLTVPALMLGLPDPRMALGTNKGQSVFGAIVSLLSFARAGKVDRFRAAPTFLAALVGSLVGVRLVLALRPQTLRPVVLVLLVGVALFFAVRRRPRQAIAAAPATPWGIAERRPLSTAGGIGLLLGVYDGFFGPGTGTFLIVLYTMIFGDDLTRATANAKVANFASNLGAVVAFGFAGAIDFRLALPMAAANALGGFLGVRAALRGGERLIRAVVLLVTAALVLRIGWQVVGE